ncbi:hypothetical protein HDZ31DRAFT_83041 [Schizophyllum fasciatum]
MTANLLNLPHDVHASIFEFLSVPGLCALSCTCRAMRDMIAEFGWADYLRVHPPLPSYSLEKSRDVWDARAIVRCEYLTERAWEKGQFVARPLNVHWRTKLQPALALNSSRLLVAAAHTISSYAFDCPKPRIRNETSWALSNRFSSTTDVTALACTDDPDSYIVGMWDGSIKRVEIRQDSRDIPAQHHHPPSLHMTEIYQYRDSIIESLMCEDDHLLSLTSSGRATVRRLSSPHDSISSIELGERSWISYLCTSASTPFAAFGTSSQTPLVLHRLLQDGSMSPDMRVHMREIPARPSSSACYAIARAPPAAPWGASPELLVAGWYDGRVRLYDLRIASRYHYPAPASPTEDCATPPVPTPLLRPTLAMSDPWLYDPIYSVACGGGAGAHIAAGSARHGVVCLWDMRYAQRRGLSVHAPGNDPSPVFKLAFESSRLYGVTDRRAFVFDWVSACATGC